jgi:hypothetical protein
MNETEFRSGKRADGTNIGQPFDYMAECDKTCSTVFRPEQVEVLDMRHVLMGVKGFAEDLNLIKKLLFRGKTRDDLNFPPAEKPTVGDLIEGLSAINAWSPADIDVLHGAVGVITEAGEVAEYLLNFLEGNGFDRVNVLEESGDIGWYVVRSLRGIGVTRDVCDVANIDKLRGRHGEAFDVFRDANRNLTAEHSKLEDAYNGAAPATPLFDGVEVVKNPVDDKLAEYYSKGVEAVEARGEMGDMADRIRATNNADSVKTTRG